MRTGAVLNFAASHAHIIGTAISHAIGQGATMVSAIWGVFIWKEFARAPLNARKLIALFLDQIDTEVWVSLKVS
jgi:glucose uptake protein